MDNPPSPPVPDRTEELPLRMAKPKPSTRTALPSSRPSRRKTSTSSTSSSASGASTASKASKSKRKSSIRETSKVKPLDFVREEYHAQDQETFCREVAVWTAMEDLKDELYWHAPQLIGASATARSYVTEYPAMQLHPLNQPLDFPPITVPGLSLLRAKLRKYIDLMYDNGIGYQVSPDSVYLASSRVFVGWELFLGGVVCSDFCETSKRTEPGWCAKRERQYNAIQLMFNFVEPQLIRSEAEQDMEKASHLLLSARFMMQEQYVAIKHTQRRMNEAEARLQAAYSNFVENYREMKSGDGVIERAHNYLQKGLGKRRNAEYKMKAAEDLERKTTRAYSTLQDDVPLERKADGCSKTWIVLD